MYINRIPLWRCFSEITCPEIQIDDISKVKVFTDGVVVGSHAKYSCVIGYELSPGVATCECLISGNWSCGPPTCTREQHSNTVVMFNII